MSKWYLQRGRWSRASSAQPCLLAWLAFARPIVATRLRSLLSPAWTRTCNFVKIQPVCDVDPTSDLLFSSVKSWSFEWSAVLQIVQTPLNNHNFVIFRCTAYSKASLERSFFFYLNEDTLFARIGLETTQRWLFEDPLWPSRRFRMMSVTIFIFGGWQ